MDKLQDWASSKWNILDGFAMISFFVGLGLRLHPTTRSAGHVVYSLDVMLWIIRLLDIFTVSKHLGPYVVMIGRMVIIKYCIPKCQTEKTSMNVSGILLVFTHVINRHVFQRKQKEAFA